MFRLLSGCLKSVVTTTVWSLVFQCTVCWRLSGDHVLPDHMVILHETEFCNNCVRAIPFKVMGRGGLEKLIGGEGGVAKFVIGGGRGGSQNP